MKKVAVAMSGGVDSAVAALLLKESGHEVVGVTMCLGVVPAEGGRAKCCGPREIEDARRVCQALGIRHYVVDFAADLEEKVIRPFVAEYCRGRTPNPCVACNRSIKFGSLLEKALAWGFDGIATGHYAGIEEENGRYRLKIPKDRRKDQTYFLHAIPKEALAKVLFPLAGYTKDEVRGIAERAGLPVFDKPESQDICFIPAEGHGAFLRSRGAGIEPGEIVDREGRVLGRHRGIACYTIGQRGGLGISSPAPLYVLAIDAATKPPGRGRRRGSSGRRAWWRIRSIVWSMPSRRRPGPRSATPTGRQDAGFHKRATASRSGSRSRRRPFPPDSPSSSMTARPSWAGGSFRRYIGGTR